MNSIKKFIKEYKDEVFSGPDSRFQLQVCFQIAFLPFVAFSFTAFVLWVFINMIHIFFESNGLLVHQDLRGAFVDAIMQETMYLIPYLGVFITALFFLGHFISNLLLRPFKFISDYTIKVYQSPNDTFSPSTVNELKLPISFGIRFFHYLNESRKMKRLVPAVVEEKYAQIKKPIFDVVFFVHYFIFLGIACAIATWGLYMFTIDMHERIVNLSLSILKSHSQSLVHFLNQQKEILDTVLVISSGILCFCYILLGQIIVSKVNGVSYNFFRTMREFMGGNYHARVKLRGNDPAHGYADSLNILLDHVVNEEVKDVEWKNDDGKSKKINKVA